MRLVPGVALCLALLTVPAGAQAAQRYAAPNGTGLSCTRQEPCSFQDAVNAASENDEVIVTAGEYTISGAPLNVVYPGLQIHGDPGGPMPRVTAALGGLPAIRMSAEGSSISYLEVVNKETEGEGIRCRSTSRVERVRATGIGEGAAGVVQEQECLVRDSLLRGEGTNSLGMDSRSDEPTSTVRNVTAIATGVNSVGIQSRYTGGVGGHHTLTVSNSIASGSTFDLRAENSVQWPGSDPGLQLELRQHLRHRRGHDLRPRQPVGAAGLRRRRRRRLPRGPRLADHRRRLRRGDRGARPGGQSAGCWARPPTSAPSSSSRHRRPRPLPPSPRSLFVPKAFRPLKRGGAVASATQPKRGTTVRYELTGAAAVGFTVERALRGRVVGGRCRKQTPANRGKRKCTRFKKLRGGFSHQGAAGPNRFRFSGRLRGRALRPGKYRLVGRIGATSRSARFTIVR